MAYSSVLLCETLVWLAKLANALICIKLTFAGHVAPVTRLLGHHFLWQVKRSESCSQSVYNKILPPLISLLCCRNVSFLKSTKNHNGLQLTALLWLQFKHVTLIYIGHQKSTYSGENVGISKASNISCLQIMPPQESQYIFMYPDVLSWSWSSLMAVSGNLQRAAGMYGSV